MSEVAQDRCLFCGLSYSNEVFAVEEADFYAGRKIRFAQGNRQLSGMAGVIVRPYSTTMFPGVYLVQIINQGNMEARTRFDHMMFEDKIESDIHYRELYEHRLRGDKYEYPSLHELLSQGFGMPETPPAPPRDRQKDDN